jgi:hypothetical protein
MFNKKFILNAFLILFARVSCESNLSTHIPQDDSTAKELYESLLAKRKLRTCLIEHHNSERGPSGRPLVCEDVAKMFEAAAGADALEQVTKIFNKFYSK